jgi:hypothetical protein
MKRPYFGMLFIIVVAILLIAFNHFNLTERLTNFLVVGFLISYYIGQYSMRLPKQ